VPRVHYKGRQGDYYVMVSGLVHSRSSVMVGTVLFACFQCRKRCLIQESLELVLSACAGHGYAWT
jgi:hypothetical protein